MVWGTGAVVHFSSPTKQGLSLKRVTKDRITQEGLASPVTRSTGPINNNCKYTYIPSPLGYWSVPQTCQLQTHFTVKYHGTQRRPKCSYTELKSTQSPACTHSPTGSLNKHSLSIYYVPDTVLHIWESGVKRQSLCHHEVYVPRKDYLTNNVIFDGQNASKIKGECVVRKDHLKRSYISAKT